MRAGEPREGAERRPSSPKAVRLQLWLAKAGVASRRRAEALITAGEVAVNGRVVRELGTKVDPVRDRVSVGGRLVRPQRPTYLLVNKPKGYVTTAKDPEGRATVFALLPGQDVRLFAVGRLDYNTEGALLLTNDGELAHRLMHPSRGVRKVYHVKLQGQVTREQLRRLREGVDLPPPAGWDREEKGVYRPERSAPAEVEVLGDTGRHTWLEIALTEGKNRQIHRMAAAVGSSVRKLIRVAYGPLSIEGLETGAHRQLSEAEVATLRRLVGLRPRPAPAEPEEKKAPPPKRPPGRRPGTDEKRARRATGRGPGPAAKQTAPGARRKPGTRPLRDRPGRR